MAAERILLTGATGYAGGTFLDRFVKSEDAAIKAITIDALTRTDDVEQKLKEAYGDRINTIRWAGLTDLEFIENTASSYDIVVNVGSGFFADGAKAFVKGLARRVRPKAPAPWILHISGCTNLGDKPITGKAYPGRVFDDTNSRATYDWCKEEDERTPYPQRTAEIGVLTLADELGVNAVSLNAPAIFGEGTGLFNKQGIIVPVLMRYAVMKGYGFKLNDTANFDWVHVEDLADAYILLIKLILERYDRGIGHIPSGKDGILHPSVGRVLQTEIMERCLDACFVDGVLPREDTPKEKTIVQKGLQEIADDVTAGMLDLAESGWAGNKAMTGTVLPKLGWKPRHLEEAWAKEFHDELKASKEGRRGYIFDSCVGRKE
ncbi:hypothetical protein QBC40DRAFT_282170 [Triangularia verruculosa]|uniref:NAD-dependent epimerase/dehydratase domain-containing protein n=1 Tax=Triangularia verruculosa TaxID=2587418 RepID=A0AAN6XK45_9PEZI|nr:hypothetical protein QBC40DRAFT_282170 [Triangularia verruculosa]